MREAMTRIGEKKYYVQFLAASSVIHKTALCVAERGSVMISFEEAPNWRLVEMGIAYAVEILEPRNNADTP
jgi:hypothetical protein